MLFRSILIVPNGRNSPPALSLTKVQGGYGINFGLRLNNEILQGAYLFALHSSTEGPMNASLTSKGGGKALAKGSFKRVKVKNGQEYYVSSTPWSANTLQAPPLCFAMSVQGEGENVDVSGPFCVLISSGSQQCDTILGCGTIP